MKILNSIVPAIGLLYLFSCGRGTEPSYLTSPDVENGQEIRLEQNNPNPFNPSTRISFAIPASMHVRLRVFTDDWQRVTTLVDEVLPAGFHSVTWGARNSSGDIVPSGYYYYVLEAGGNRLFRQMRLAK